MELIRQIAKYVERNQSVNEDIGDAFECGWNAHQVYAAKQEIGKINKL